MINSEIFLTNKPEYSFSQDEIQKSDSNGEETMFHKYNHKCFSGNNLVTYWYLKNSSAYENFFLFSTQAFIMQSNLKK